MSSRILYDSTNIYNQNIKTQRNELFPSISMNYYVVVPIGAINKFGYKSAAVIGCVIYDANRVRKAKKTNPVVLAYTYKELADKLKISLRDVSTAFMHLNDSGLVSVDFGDNETDAKIITFKDEFFNLDENDDRYKCFNTVKNFVSLSLLIIENCGLEASFLFGILLSFTRIMHQKHPTKKIINGKSSWWYLPSDNYVQQLKISDSLKKLHEEGLLEYKTSGGGYCYCLNLDEIQTKLKRIVN